MSRGLFGFYEAPGSNKRETFSKRISPKTLIEKDILQSKSSSIRKL